MKIKGEKANVVKLKINDSELAALNRELEELYLHTVNNNSVNRYSTLWELKDILNINIKE